MGLFLLNNDSTRIAKFLVFLFVFTTQKRIRSRAECYVFGPMSSHVVICRSEPVLPMLTFAQKKGNPTFYEWRTGKVPTVVEGPVAEEALSESVADDAVGFTVSRVFIDHGCVIKNISL